MRLLDPTWIRDNVDYSFGDESGMGVGGYMKVANADNQEFMNLYRQAVEQQREYMTLFIDNMRLYRRDCWRFTAVEQHNEQWRGFRRDKFLQFANEDLLHLCTSLPDMKFVIFTGFEDISIDEGIWNAIPENVLAIYASNALIFGDKVHPIPFGIQRLTAPNDARHDVILSMIETLQEPTRLMYINFNTGNHPERPILANRYAQFPWVTVHHPGMGLVYTDAARNYYGNIKAHKFMLCPSGNAEGCECHRDIEALYMRRVPIVTDTPYHRAIFELLQAPVLYVDNLMNVTEQLLIDNDHLYRQMQTYDMSRLDIEVLYNRCLNEVNRKLHNIKNVLCLGCNGFIGSHLAKRLKGEGHWVRVVDIKRNEYMQPVEFCDENIIGDLRDDEFVKEVMRIPGDFDEVYQLAADMGGAGYVFTKEHDADIMHNSALVNINVAYEAPRQRVKRLLYTSSACIYPEHNQVDPDNPNCEESSAIPANPDSMYGWEKLFSEFLYSSFERNYGLNVRIARLHNVFGPLGAWRDGREKAPAAICRKVAMGRGVIGVLYPEGDTIDIWGDGSQTRSFLYIDEAVEGIIRLMRSDCTKVLNIGSEEMISINDLAKMVIEISGKNLTINNIPGPTGVRGRNSHNKLIQQELNWAPTQPLRVGMEKLYKWIEQQVNTNI